jgi:alpha-beta hydrolase superfamily lysophospholipase
MSASPQTKSNLIRQEGRFLGHDEIELYYQYWQCPNAKGLALVTHGLGEHSDRYNHLAESLSGIEWSTLAWELRGHGRSDGKRGYASSFDDFVLDHQSFIDLALKEMVDPKTGFVHIAHSLGGMITLLSLMRFGDRGAKAVCLSSPLVDVALKVPPVKDKAAHVLARILPKVTLHNEIKIEQLTHDKKMQQIFAKDPLRHEKISAEVYLGMGRGKIELFQEKVFADLKGFLQSL